MYVGLVAGTLSMAIGMTLLNYLVFLPMYSYFLNFPMESGSALMNTLVYGILPFNLIKGALITVVMVLLFKKLKPYLDKVSKTYQVA